MAGRAFDEDLVIWISALRVWITSGSAEFHAVAVVPLDVERIGHLADTVLYFAR